jgi:RNA polymerase sigma-70 factor (ECF subfamily)
LIEKGIQSEVASNLSKSLNKLTPRQREAVMHFFYEGYTYKEVAEMMELKQVKYARKLIYRALESLRKDLPDIKAIF